MELNTRKTPAPALANGLAALRILNREGPLSLEQLAEISGIPKSSLLRLMDTLIELNMVQRDPDSKQYHSLSAIVPLASYSESDREIIKRALREVSEATMKTAEWYVLKDTEMVIIDRSEPQGLEVKILARIGFERQLEGELEAVARVALAFGVANWRPHDYWIFQEGIKTEIDSNKVEKALKSVRENGQCMDKEYNLNGVRRYAAPVFNNSRKLVGIMALAENFTPFADRKIPEVENELLETTKKLELNLAKINN